MPPSSARFTARDLVVLSVLSGMLVGGWAIGALGWNTLLISLTGATIAVLAYAVLGAKANALSGGRRPSRKLLHLAGGSVLVSGVLLFPQDASFLALTLFTTYLTYEVLRWSPPRGAMWLSLMLDSLGSPEEEVGRPFSEAVLGLAAVCAVLYAFEPRIALVALVNLTFGDGVAGLIRERLGERGRTHGIGEGWRGSVIGSLTSSMITLLLTHDPLFLVPVLAGMVVERSPIPIDDNVTVPLSTAVAAWLLAASFPGCLD